jgi:hypothetical protein
VTFTHLGENSYHDDQPTPYHGNHDTLVIKDPIEDPEKHRRMHLCALLGCLSTDEPMNNHIVTPPRLYNTESPSLYSKPAKLRVGTLRPTASI